MKHPRNRMSLPGGIMSAALAPTFVTVVYVIAIEGLRPTLAGATFIVGFVFVMSLVGVLALGVPVVLILRRWEMFTWAAAAGAGALAGWLYIAALALLLSRNHQLPPAAEFIPSLALGLVAGLAFRAGAGPNNSSKPTPLRGAA